MAQNHHKDKPDVLPPDHGSQPPEEGLVLARHIYPGQLPILPFQQRPLFPKMTVPIHLDDPAIVKMVMDTAQSSARFLGAVLARESVPLAEDARVTGAHLHDVGVIAEIVQVSQLPPPQGIGVILNVLDRFRITGIVQEKPYIVAKVEHVIESEMVDNPELKAYSIAVIKTIKELIQLNPLHKEELNLFMSRSNLHEPGRLADFSAALTTASGPELQEILATLSIRDRLRKALVLLKKEIDVSKIQAQIGKQIEEKVTKQQRDYFLREQLKAIKKELGLAKEGKEAEVEKFMERLAKLKLTEEARRRVDEELDKIKLLEPASPEYHVSHTYLDWLTSLPWGVLTQDRLDLVKAERVLSRDHFGLDDVKDRILEFLAVGIMKGRMTGSILCFVGPPGVGKTSIGQSIARSMGRQFYRFSVGGIRDEAEIKGHRRTYIGALPGKFIQTMKLSQSANPVIMLDEIDKIGASYQGDPASALLEVLDPEQNRDFLDHYLDVRFDLSNVFFVCTANQTDTIPRPLLDRMEVITLSGYILEEKLQIAKRYLVPKQMKEHGIAGGRLSISPPAMRAIIDGYAREPGVRSLDKCIRKIMRKSVKRMVKDPRLVVKVDAKDVKGYLGNPPFAEETLYAQPRIGVMTGLAWTSMGGATLHIEAAAVAADKSGYKQTGQLGAVMVESSEIAYTHVRAMLNRDAKAREFFEKRFIHLHVPAGATPKDGPSAGITMAAALYSLVKNKAPRKGLAMTGELSLTGRVMPIGGLKEKTIAAKRAKVKTLIFPADNRHDWDDLPAHIRRGVQAHFVRTFDEVVRLTFA
ncbi:MAG: endopeptidase La [Lentisphaerae bacterium]|nr:endopeptidase La [Lentisphaerota bacterium]